jgi:hypothetical protein
MNKTIYGILIILIACNWVATAQTVYTITGKVSNSQTGEAIDRVNIRVAGTTRGTITNSDGSYILNLPADNYTLIYSYVGCQRDSVHMSLTKNISCNIKLEPADIILPEVVTIAEDPAYAIIREAIKKKHELSKLLSSYTLKAFTRVKFYRDTSIAGITESYTDGYWHQGDSLREVVTQKHMTTNLPEAEMVASVGEIVNFTEDIIPLLGFKFIGPIAENALEYYDYKLLRTLRKNHVDIYEISIVPKSRIIPLFQGKISIADSKFAVMGIEVKPNEAFHFPFVSNLEINFNQAYSLYDEKFWMPTNILMAFGGKISIPGMSFPNIKLDQTSVIYDYQINTIIADSILKKPVLVVDSLATQYDSTFWSVHCVIPFTSVEEKAYKTLDSTQTLAKQFKPTGATASLLNFLTLRYIDIRYNRVEGLFLGGTYTYVSGKRRQAMGISSNGEYINSSTRTGWVVNAAAGYGLSDKIFKWQLGGDYPLDKDNSVEVGANVYKDIAHFPDGGFYPTILTSICSLFGRNDYRDYYMTYGWDAHLNVIPFDKTSLVLSVKSEKETSVQKTTDFCILSFRNNYRVNPPIAEGQMRSLQLDVYYGPDKGVFNIVPIKAVEVSAEYSSPSLIASDFNFSQYYMSASYFFPTFLQSYLLPPQMNLMFAGGTSTATLPPQREFVLDSQLDRFAAFGVLRTAYPREFIGDRFVMISAEHNFRSVPFLMLGIPFLYKRGLEVLIDVTAAQSWLNGNSMTNGWYYEAGIGIGKIFGLIRADLTYRISKPNDLFFTIGISDIL